MAFLLNKAEFLTDVDKNSWKLWTTEWKVVTLGIGFHLLASITALASLEAARPTLEVKTDPSCNYFSLSGSQFSLDFINIS